MLHIFQCIKHSKIVYLILMIKLLSEHGKIYFISFAKLGRYRKHMNKIFRITISFSSNQPFKKRKHKNVCEQNTS